MARSAERVFNTVRYVELVLRCSGDATDRCAILARSLRMLKATTALFVLALSVLPSGPVHAASTLEGTWSGSGYVVPESGARESVRCRVRFSRQSSKVFGVEARCSSATTDIVQTGEVIEVSSGRFAGDFYNPQYDISGRIRIQMSGNHQTVTFSGKQGRGSLSLTKK